MRLFLLSLTLVSALWAQGLSAKTFLIYSVAQDLPMGTDNQVIKKNFYVNMGKAQGLKNGTLLDVFRVISVLNPYDNRKRINHKVKIGELKVLHATDEGAIANLHKMEDENMPVLDLDQFIVGDLVSVNVD